MGQPAGGRARLCSAGRRHGGSPSAPRLICQRSFGRCARRGRPCSGPHLRPRGTASPNSRSEFAALSHFLTFCRRGAARCDTPSLHWPTTLVEHRNPHPAEVIGVAGRPDEDVMFSLTRLSESTSSTKVEARSAPIAPPRRPLRRL